jgi:uncharacterized Rmd1/YagE family protein
MTTMAQNIVPIAAPARYRLQAYSSPVKINTEQCKAVFLPSPGRVERFNRDCSIFHRYEEEKIYIFKFGAAVFFNVPVTEHEYYLSKLGIAARPTTASASFAAEGNEITEDDFIINVESGTPRVGFNFVTLNELEPNKVQLIAQVLAQSSALELIEREVDSFLAESEQMSTLLKNRTLLKGNRERLLRFLGASLSARHRIVNQLSLLKEPDKTWEKEDLYFLYKELFEIDDRIEKIERMLQLSSQVTELLLEIVNARRAEFLEITVIILIFIEIVKSFFG